MNRLARMLARWTPARWLALPLVTGLIFTTGCTTNKYYGDRDRDHDHYRGGHGHRYAYDRDRDHGPRWDR